MSEEAKKASPPSTISELALLRLKLSSANLARLEAQTQALQLQLQQFAQQMKEESQKYDTMVKHMETEYELDAQKDRIDLDTGTITRAPRKEALKG